VVISSARLSLGKLGVSVITRTTTQIRLVAMEQASTKLRIIHRRWAAKSLRRAANNPARDVAIHSVASTVLLARATGPYGVLVAR